MIGTKLTRLTYAAFAVAVVFVSWTVNFSATARAADYTVYACKGPQQQSLGADGWKTTGTPGAPGFQVQDDCPGGELTARMSGHPYKRGTKLGLRVSAPEGTTIEQYQSLRRIFTTGEPQYRWSYGWLLNVDPVGPATTRTYGICTGPCNSRNERFSEIRRDDIHAEAVEESLSCEEQRPEDCGAGEAYFAIREARITLRDEVSPELSEAPTGTLLETGTVQAGPRQLHFSATDQGSGVRQAVVEIDGIPVVSQSTDQGNGQCQEPFSRLVPCPLSVRQTLSVDTSVLPDGPHAVRLLLADATGVTRSVYGPVTIHTANGLGALCSEAASRVSVSLDLTRRVLRYGQRSRASGIVKAPDGRPVPGTAVAVVNKDGGATIATAISDAKGRYRVVLPKTPSIALLAAVRSGTDDFRSSCSAVKRLSVRGGATLDISPKRLRNGQVTTLRGRVRGVVPPQGKALLVEARGTGQARWATVRYIRSDAAGKYKFRYRFRRTIRATRYDFRVVLARENGFPYASGVTRIRRVTVRP